MQEFDISKPPFALLGALDVDHGEFGISPRRLPAWTRPQVPGFMEIMLKQPSGVRLVFVTDSPVIELDVCLTRMQMADKPPRRATFDLLCDGELLQTTTSDTGHVLSVDLRKPAQPQLMPGAPATLSFTELPPGKHEYQLWLPTSAQVELRALRIAPEAALQAAAESTAQRWVHYGSSISHCAEARSPSQSWPAVAASRANLNLQNLGFGGNCQLDQFVARTIRDLPADFISLKLGINIVNMDAMRERVFAPAVHGFLDTVREAHATTPILIVSPIFCPSAETHPGPTLPNEAGKFVTFAGHEQLRAGCLTLTWIRKILQRLVAQRHQAGDENLHYLNGLALFGAADAADLPDDLHPNGKGYIRMGERFHNRVFSATGILAV